MSQVGTLQWWHNVEWQSVWVRIGILFKKKDTVSVQCAVCTSSSDFVKPRAILTGKNPPISIIYTFQELITATLSVAWQSACCIFQTSQWALSFFRKPVNFWETRSFIWGWKTTTCFKQFSHDKSIVSVRVFRKVCEGVRGMHVCAHLSGSV